MTPNGGPSVPGILPVLLRKNPGGVFAPAIARLREDRRRKDRRRVLLTIYIVERKTECLVMGCTYLQETVEVQDLLEVAGVGRRGRWLSRDAE